MPTLQILRHAKSSWRKPSQKDHDRPLTKRGLRAAAEVGRWLAENDAAPDVVMCSTAVRAVQTCEVVLAALHSPPQRYFEAQLYMAGPRRVLELTCDIDPPPARLMVIGHNPALQILAATMAAMADPAAGEAMAQRFGTATLAQLDFQSSWGALTPSCVTAVRCFAPPREPG